MKAPGRVLVVEDEPAQLELMRRWLVHNGHEVVAAASGVAALEAAQAHPVAALITDLRMPGMSGLEVLTEVRKICPGIAAIVITGESPAGELLDALQAGTVAACLLKPIRDLRMLSGALAEAMARGDT